MDSVIDLRDPDDQARFNLKTRVWEALGLTLEEFSNRWRSGGYAWTYDPTVLGFGRELDALDRARDVGPAELPRPSIADRA
jgi:hypothetical protein